MPQPGRRRKLARLGAAGLGLVALAAAAAFALPRVVEHRVLAVLAEAGIDDAALIVESVGWRETLIADVRIGGDLSIAAVAARYAPGDVIDGRVREVVVNGLRLRAAVTPDGVSLGALDPLVRGGGGTPTIPFGALALRDARIEVATPAGAIAVTADGTTDIADGRENGQRIHAEAAVALDAAQGAANGVLILETTPDGAFTARFDVADGRVSFPPLRADGVTGAVAARGSGAALDRVEVHLSLARVALPAVPLAVGEIDATLAGGRLSADGVLGSADGAITAAASATVADVNDSASPFVVEGELAITDPVALGQAAPALAGVAGRGRASLTLSGVLPDAAALAGAADLRAGLTTLALAGAFDLALDEVAVPGVAAGLSIRGKVTAETAEGALIVSSAGGVRIAAAGLDPALLDAFDPPSVARPYLEGPLKLELGSGPPVLLKVRPTPDAVALDATAGGRLTLAGGAIVTADFDAAAELAPEGALRRFGLRRITASAKGLTFAGTDVALVDLRLNLAGTPDAFAGGARLDLAAGRLEAAGVSVERPRLTASGGFAFRDGGLAVTLDEGTSLGAARVFVADAFQTAGPVILRVVATEDPAFAIDFGVDGVAVRLRLALPGTEAAVLLPDGQALMTAVEAPDLRLDGEARLPDGAYAGTLTITDGAVRLPAHAVVLEGIDATLDADSAGPATGRLAAFTVGELRHTAEPPRVAPLRLDGTVDRDGDGLAFTGHIGDIGGRMAIVLAGNHDFARGKGHAAIVLERLRFDPDALRPADLAPMLAGIVSGVRGTVAANGRLGWDGGGLASELTLLVEDVSLRAGGMALERVNSVVGFDSLWPPSTPPGQLAAIGLIDAGLPLTDGVVAFRLEPGGALQVESAVWRWADGALRTGGLVLDANAARREFTLEAADLDLAEIVALANIDALTATGRLSGRVPVAVTDDGVIIRGGLLEAAEGGGVLRYAPSGAPAALRQAGEAATLMLTALENFNYETMRITLDRAARGETDVAVHLRGSNPDFYDGYPVEFNLTISGELDRMLRRGLEGYRVPDAILERLQSFGN